MERGGAQHKKNLNNPTWQYLEDKQGPRLLPLALPVHVGRPQEPRAEHGVEKHVTRQQRHAPRHGAHAHQVEDEVARVAGPQAVVHPDAVVVKALDAPVAHS